MEQKLLTSTAQMIQTDGIIKCGIPGARDMHKLLKYADQCAELSSPLFDFLSQAGATRRSNQTRVHTARPKESVRAATTAYRAACAELYK